jgi:hypothetical protein
MKTSPLEKVLVSDRWSTFTKTFRWTGEGIYPICDGQLDAIFYYARSIEGLREHMQSLQRGSLSCDAVVTNLGLHSMHEINAKAEGDFFDLKFSHVPCAYRVCVCVFAGDESMVHY